VAKKFSLKDNPIFQRLEVPKPKEATPNASEPPASAEPPAREQRDIPAAEDQSSTLENRPSENTPQKTSLTESTAPSTGTPPSPDLTGEPAPDSPSGPDLDLKDDLDKSLFFGYYTEVADELFPRLDPAEQVLYHRLFRLSYGFSRNYCTVSQPLLMEGTGLSRNTIRTALQSLVVSGWIKVVEAGKHIATTYRVVLPRERIPGDEIKSSINNPLKLTFNNRASKKDAQKMSLKTRDSDFKDGQNLAPQTLTLRRWQTNKPPERLSNTEGRYLLPMSGAFTHTSPRFVEASPDPQNLTPWSQVLSAKELVEKFYSRLGQRASKTKREQSVQECLGLLQQGFTLEEVDYAISWFIEQHRRVGSFMQLVQCIDQALKERQTTQPRPETQQHIRAADC